MPTTAVSSSSSKKTTIKSPSVALRLGSRGSNVLKVQQRLKALGINPGPADGVFGAKTRAAVIAFQKKHGLTADGLVGPKTWAKLFATSSKPKTSSSTVKAPASKPTLRLGSKGSSVATVQKRLNQLGFKCGTADGVFGAKTRSAVIAFQKKHGLTADGIVGPKTWAKMFGTSSTSSKPKTGGTKATAPKSTTGSGPTLRLGSKGSAVVSLQKRLNQLGYKCGTADGSFGAKTRAAVIAFQKKHGLTGDGVVGPKTWAKLGITVKGSSGTGAVTPSGSFATKVLSLARSQLGVHETPMGSNRQKYSSYFGRPPEPWCADFVSWVYTHAGKKLNIPYTPTLLQYIKNNGTYHRYNPKPGEIVLYDWAPGSGVPAEHTGIVEKVFVKNGVQYMQTIEGNYGNKVQRRVIAVSNSTIRGFGTVK